MVPQARYGLPAVAELNVNLLCCLVAMAYKPLNGNGMPQAPSTWSNGLFGCFDDFNECLDGFFCCWCKLGYMQQRMAMGSIGMDTGTCAVAFVVDYCCCGLGTPIYTYNQRSQIKLRYNIADEGNCTSCLIAFCCDRCAICQQAREMTARGEFCGGVCASTPPPGAPMGVQAQPGQPYVAQGQPQYAQPHQQQQGAPQQYPPQQQAGYQQQQGGYPQQQGGYQQQQGGYQQPYKEQPPLPPPR